MKILLSIMLLFSVGCMAIPLPSNQEELGNAFNEGRVYAYVETTSHIISVCNSKPHLLTVIVVSKGKELRFLYSCKPIKSVEF